MMCTSTTKTRELDSLCMNGAPRADFMYVFEDLVF